MWYAREGKFQSSKRRTISSCSLRFSASPTRVLFNDLWPPHTSAPWPTTIPGLLPHQGFCLCCSLCLQLSQASPKFPTWTFLPYIWIIAILASRSYQSHSNTKFLSTWGQVLDMTYVFTSLPSPLHSALGSEWVYCTRKESLCHLLPHLFKVRSLW